MEFQDICFITDDVPALVRFYETLFDTKAEGDDIHSALCVSGLHLAIYNKDAAIHDMGFDLGGAGTGLMTIGFGVDDADGACARIRAMNLCPTTDPVLWPWGAKSFRLRDPDGNVLVFRSIPKLEQST